MCYNPVHIRSNNIYRNSNVSACCYDVPCGKCESCRDNYRSMWKCRIWHELDYTYSHGGCAVFLTFTYNNDHLPLLQFNGHSIPVFNHEHVKTFLNRLKIRMYRSYGKNKYKYFIAMEYGKHTKRQHLHGLFFLDKSVNYADFTELCRSIWCEHGYMFPKCVNGRYLKDDGTDDCPLIRDIVKGSVYVSKYVTKDLSFYELPSIVAFAHSNPDLMRSYVPKHYQSNNLGISILEKIDLSSDLAVVDSFTVGISVPYSKSPIALPRYIKKKLLFRNIKSDRLGVNGKYLYDSMPTALFHSVSTLLYERMAFNMIQYVRTVFARYISLFPSITTPIVKDYNLLSNYILYFKNVDSHVLSSFCTYFDGAVDSFSDFSKVGFFYSLSKDNSFLKNNQYVSDSVCTFPFDSVFPSWLVDAYHFFTKASSFCEELQVNEFRKRSDERDRVRYKYQYYYPKNLC